MKVSFDIGGVLTKYPEQMRALATVMDAARVELHVITDMNRERALELIRANDLNHLFPPERVHGADWKEHEERCKAVLLEQLEIDIHIDDYPSYCITGGKTITFFVWPRPDLPYNGAGWSEAGKPVWTAGGGE